MNRRDNPRHRRRLRVRFWKDGQGDPIPGHTTDVSLTGMFLSTSRPLAKGSRVRVEVMEGEGGFMLEGLVVRASKVRPEFHSIKLSGMGIRFLAVDELVGGALATQAAQVGSQDETPPPPGVYRVSFETREEFLTVFRRDLSNGGLFINTASPAVLDDVVTAEIRLSWNGNEPLSFPARVVHRVDPEGSQGPNLVAGIGVQFVDPEAVLRALTPFAT